MKINFKIESERDALKYILKIINLRTNKKYKLTSKELDILVEFNFLPDKYTGSPFSTESRKYVLKTLLDNNFKINYTTLRSYIYSLRRKGYILKTEKEMYFNPLLTDIYNKVLHSLQQKKSLSVILDFDYDKTH